MDIANSHRARIRYLVVRLGMTALAATVVLAAIVFFFQAQVEVVIHWYVVVLGLLFLGALDRFIVGAYPVRLRSALDHAWQAQTVEPERPERLEELERQISFGHASLGDFRYRLLPPLRDLAIQLLAMHRSIDAETDPVLARTVLGDDVWETHWPPEEERWDRHGRGGDIGTVHRVVEALEKLEDNNRD